MKAIVKKLPGLIAAVLLIGAIFIAKLIAGESVNVPVSQNSNPLDSASYGGVDIATASFSAGVATACVPSTTGAFITANVPNVAPGVLHGVIISSDTNADFVDFYDTNTCGSVPGDANLMFRVYVDTSTTGTGASGVIKATSYWLPYPARFNNGLCFKPSVATLNKVTVFYYKRRGGMNEPR